MNWLLLLNSLVYSVVGLVVFCLGFFIIDRFTPYDLWNELVKEKMSRWPLSWGRSRLGFA